MICSNKCSLLYRINQFLFIMEPDCNFYYYTECKMCRHTKEVYEDTMLCCECEDVLSTDTTNTTDELPF